MHAIRLSILALVSLGLAYGAEPTQLVFRPDDRWAVIGDSITQGRRYHSFIYLFHATRYPGRAFQYHNCGIAGDTAAGAVRRFDWDIGAHQPTVATILLGMNDVGRGLYAPGQTGAAVEARRQEAITAHLANLEQLAERLKAMSCRTIFITPSIYDQTAAMPGENCVGVNEALGACGDGARALAAKLGTSVIDLHTPMTALNARLQKADPAATLVGPDRIHPGDAGQLVIAYFILKGMGVSGIVSDIAIDAAAGTVTRQSNSTVGGVSGRNGTMSFTCTAAALPYPVLPAAEAALNWVPFTEELNREMVTVSGLPKGWYSFRIDGSTVAVISSDDLSKGLNLSGNPKSPMLLQAQKVMKEAERWHAVAANIRNIAAQRHEMTRVNPKLDGNDYEAVKAALLADLEKRKGTPQFAYLKARADLYIDGKPREAAMCKELEQRATAIWRLNQPVPHRFEILPATAEERAAQDAPRASEAGANLPTEWVPPAGTRP